MNSIFFEITVIICLAAILAIVFRALKQPPILAYILTGIIVGPLSLANIEHVEVLRTLGEFGITFLLFMLGLELQIKELRSVGKPALLTGIGQIVFTCGIGYLILLLLGFSLLSSFYIAIALTFSSTIIIVKLLTDLRDQNSLYGKISIGFLLVQDFVAIVLLILLSSVSEGFSVVNIGFVLLKGVLLFVGTVYLGQKLVPKITKYFAKSQETLFLFSIAWAFGISALVSSRLVGFSIEIGGFLAGLSLASTVQNYQIVSKIRPLRDFFITIFFVILGIQMVFSDIISVIPLALILSAFVLIGNPLIVLIILSLLGYKSRVGLLAGLTVAQISEFSLIVVFLGMRLGHLEQSTVSLVTLVGIITFTGSTYMILNGRKLYRILAPYIRVFERKRLKQEMVGSKDLTDHIVLVGANRTGDAILSEIQNQGLDAIVVDYDPDVEKRMRERGVVTLFGDITDEEIQEKASLSKAKVVISTSGDLEHSLILADALRRVNKRVKYIAIAKDTREEEELYASGVDYVVIPRLTTGQKIAQLIKEEKFEKLDELREKERIV